MYMKFFPLGISIAILIIIVFETLQVTTTANPDSFINVNYFVK